MNKTEKDITKLSDDRLLEETKKALGVISSSLSIPLFLAFWIADILIYPQHMYPFLLIRLLIIPICFFAVYYAKKVTSYRSAQNVAAIYAIVTASLINSIIFIIDDISTPYYAGLNLVAIAGLSFIPFQTIFVLFVAAGIYLPYFVIVATNHNLANHYGDILINSFFISGSIIICVIIRYAQNKLRTNDLNSQLALEDELDSREKIIKQKTEEATKLNQLSAQFSPQVVKAIKDGSISINEGVQRAKICAIFIDIVRSTDKVTTLDENNIQLCLARFLDSCLTTFLKYDLTIDKFHGDGVLAFSNMPIQRSDFIERTCIAAFEATNLIKNDRDFYLKHWQSEMQVRVGISVGYANVGFYGDKKFFKTFTAIGIPLPYASRLTSVAEPNQILVDNEIAEQLEKSKFVLKISGKKP